MRTLHLIAAVAAMAIAIPALSASPVTTSDLLRIRSVTSIDVSNDGLEAVYAVRSIGEEPDGNGDAGGYEYRSHLYKLDLFDAAAEPKQLTFDARYDTAPVLSPDGGRVAFQRASGHELDEEGHRPTQIWVMRLDGGEARQVTTFAHGAWQPRWSPDGRSLLVHAPVSMDELGDAPPWSRERPQREAGAGPDVEPRPDGTRDEIRAWLGRNAEGNDPFVINRLHFQGELGLHGAMRFTQLFIVDPEDEQDVRQLSSAYHDHGDARFTPDGRGVVFTTKAPTEIHPDRVMQRNIGFIDLAGGDPRTLVSIDGFRLGSPRFGPGGDTLAFTAQELDEPAYRQQRLGAVTLRGAEVSEPIWLTEPESYDNEVWSIEWLPARTSLLFNTARAGGFPLMVVKPGRLGPSPLIETESDHPIGVNTFAAGGGTLVYTVSGPSNPCVLHVMDGRADRMVHDLNPWVADRTLSTPRGDWITRPDGTRVQCWIMEPTDRQDDAKYPLCLAIHGGPSGMWGPGESSMWHEFQLLCAWGYGVVYANPRGSGGYGYDFQRGNFQDWGNGPAGDVLAACDHAATEPWVDADRLVVTGGSYAGYLTAWIVAHDQRFKAAVAQRGVYDLQTFFGEGNAWQLVPWAFGGRPWEPGIRQVLTRESPFTYVNRIRTPLLIMHASRDLRTGVSQSEMMFRALKTLERPVEFVRYPDAGHDLSRTGDPTQRMDRLNRIIEFFERHVDNPRPAPVAGPSG